MLLAGPSPDSVVAEVTGPEWEADRQALSDGSISLAELLVRRGLVLRGDLLRPWSRWITPEAEARRYDTRFFVAVMPGRSQARRGSAPGSRTGPHGCPRPPRWTPPPPGK